MSLPSPDDVREILTSPFVVMYWPLILGVIGFFIALAKGGYKSAIVVALIAAAVQVLHRGVPVAN